MPFARRKMPDTENIDIFGKNGEKSQAKNMHGTANKQHGQVRPPGTFPCYLAPTRTYCVCSLALRAGQNTSAPQGVHFTEFRT